MREYEEGILLFEATKIQVWDKASQDTIGLNKFFAANRNLFLWEERAEVETVKIASQDQKLLNKLVKKLKKKSLSSVANKFNTKTPGLISSEKSLFTQEQLPEGLKWAKASITAMTKDAREGVTTFQRIAKINPPTQKSLNESRGYVIAEYQNYLEKQWVAELKEEYAVKINQDVFNSLVKK